MKPRNCAGLKIPRRKACRFDSGPGTTDKAGSFHELPAFFFFCGEMCFGWHVVAVRGTKSTTT